MPTHPLVRIVTVTVSDTRTPETDGAHRVFAEELRAFDIVRHVIAPDEPAQIVALCRDVMTHGSADAVVLSGGTGLSPRDGTFEAIEGLLDKRLDGFGEAFRRLSWDEIGPRAILSRATAGVAGGCLLFSLPGSPAGLRLGLRELVAPIVSHAVDLVRGRTGHPARPAHDVRADAVAVAGDRAENHAELEAKGEVQVLYFAGVRDLVGRESESLALPPSVGDVRAFAAWIEEKRPALSGRMGGVRIARNEAFAVEDERLVAGDVLALIPPVAGG